VPKAVIKSTTIPVRDPKEEKEGTREAGRERGREGVRETGAERRRLA